MGSTCNGEVQAQQHKQEILHLQFRRENGEGIGKLVTFSDRFKYDVQKLKIDGNNMYKLILPVEGERSEAKVVECKFLFSYADMGMCDEYQFKLEEMTAFPIIDVFEAQNTANPQIYHKITTHDNKPQIMKYYNFTSFNDYAFKSGMYELSLYKTVPNSRLADYFILFKGDLKQLVMIFDYCYVSLHDVLYYRKMAGYEWEESEILMVARMLAQQLVELAQVDVVHRDVRPANVFFAIVGIINSGQDKTASSKRAASGLLNESINGDKFYTLMNLESARMVDRHALMQDEDEDDIFTVKGSPVFNEGPAREALLREEHKANYNPYLSDIVGLKHTLLAMVNLEPANMGANHDDRVKKRPKVHELVKYMSSAECLSIQQVLQKADQLLNINPTSKPDSYYSAVRAFYLKQLTICQIIECSLYFSIPMPKIQPQQISSSIDSRNLPQNRHNAALQYIESLYITTMYDLHKKDAFVTYMLEKLQKNFDNNQDPENVPLLVKVGQYFEDSGVKENQYYKEAIVQLTQLAETERIQGFYKDHETLIGRAEELYAKFSPESKMISRAKCMFLKEKAYKNLFQNSENTIYSSTIKSASSIPKLQLQTTQKIISQSYEQSQKANLPLQQQLQLIYAKGQLFFYMNKLQQAQSFFTNGYQIAQQNYKDFLTAHNCTKYKAMFEYALGLVEIVKIRTGVSQRTAKVVFDIQQKLQKAKERFASVSVHPVMVVKCYIAAGDLANLRQDMTTAAKNYQRALNLLHAQNQTRARLRLDSRAISARIQVEIVAKLIEVLNRSDNQMEAKKYEALHESLKKEFNLARKSQSGYSRKGKSKVKKEKELKKQEANNLDPILQVEEENKMFESKVVHSREEQEKVVHSREEQERFVHSREEQERVVHWREEEERHEEKHVDEF